MFQFVTHRELYPTSINRFSVCLGNECTRIFQQIQSETSW